ncbi:MAG: PAS domain-containing protein [Brevinematia bacterium]
MITIKEVINYLYRLKSSILLLENESEMIGYTRTKDIIALMNLGIDDPSKILNETKVYNISSLNQNEIENELFPILNFSNFSIDVISKKELKYIQSNDISGLEINFESILKNLPIPIAILDRFNRLIWLNLSFIEVLSLQESEVIGKNIMPLLPLKIQKVGKKNSKIVQSQMIAFDIKVKVIMVLP